jgi:hypothetical protein
VIQQKADAPLAVQAELDEEARRRLPAPVLVNALIA